MKTGIPKKRLRMILREYGRGIRENNQERINNIFSIFEKDVTSYTYKGQIDCDTIAIELKLF